MTCEGVLFTERNRKRVRVRVWGCARLNDGHLTRCGAHTPDVCARPMSAMHIDLRHYLRDASSTADREA